MGFLGSEASLTLLNPGDPLGALGSHAEWDGNALKITATNYTLSGYKLTCLVYGQAGTGNLTVQNCVLHISFSAIWGAFSFDASGRVTLRDTTVRVNSVDGDRSVGVTSTSNLVDCYRSDISGFEDGIGLGSGTIDQCWVHGLDGAGTDPHNDVIQHYPDLGPITVTNSYLRCSAFGNETQPAAGQTAALTFDTSTGSVGRNNFLEHGAYAFAIEGATNVTFEGNDFGAGFAFDEVTASGGYSIASWSNNRDSGGNLIPQP